MRCYIRARRSTSRILELLTPNLSQEFFEKKSFFFNNFWKKTWIWREKKASGAEFGFPIDL